jgi:DNA invertase Pin-like site-specific DNA recombinase
MKGYQAMASIDERRIGEFIDKLSPRDILIVTEVSRLSLNSAECIKILAQFNEKQIELKIVAIS